MVVPVRVSINSYVNGASRPSPVASNVIDNTAISSLKHKSG